MTFGQFKHDFLHNLAGIYSEGEAKAIATLIIENITGLPQGVQHQCRDQLISENLMKKIKFFSKEIQNGRPIQYVLGEAWFMNRIFKVNASVLIPRPETEELVRWAVACIAEEIKTSKSPRILDIGTGSGCIPVSLFHLVPHAAIFALDISGEAVMVARENATRHHADVQFITQDFLDTASWPALGRFDFIISNPPYIPAGEKAVLDKQVTDWEPSIALFTPDDDPLIFYRHLATIGQSNLKKFGTIFMEVHQNFASEVSQLFIGHDYEVQVKKDIHGNDRMIKAKKS